MYSRFFYFFNFFILSPKIANPIVTAGPNEILFYFILFFLSLIAGFIPGSRHGIPVREGPVLELI
jgi:hypothetical protein